MSRVVLFDTIIRAVRFEVHTCSEFQTSFGRAGSHSCPTLFLESPSCSARSLSCQQPDEPRVRMRAGFRTRSIAFVSEREKLSQLMTKFEKPAVLHQTIKERAKFCWCLTEINRLGCFMHQSGTQESSIDLRLLSLFGFPIKNFETKSLVLHNMQPCFTLS